MIGRRLGAFRIVGPLASGAMGRVFSAVHEPTGHAAAVKIIRCTNWREREFVDLEVAALARLRHRYLIPIYAYGTQGEDAWLAMELAVARWGDRGMQPDTLLRLTREALLGLSHAHARGVVHRDIKPDNLLIAQNGELRISDFGIAHLGQDIGIAAAGTPRFMAPEQRRGASADQGPWTDLYALGRVVQQSLTDQSSALWGWTEWLCADDPAQRPFCAASALAALPDGPSMVGPAVPLAAPTLRTQRTALSATEDIGAAAPVGATAWTALRPPTDWREGLVAPEATIRDAWAIRAPRPPRGREGVQDQLWQQAIVAPTPARIALVGPSGAGCSALVSWLEHRAREVGQSVFPVRASSVREVVRDWLGGGRDLQRDDVAAWLYRRGAPLDIAGDVWALLCGEARERPDETLLAALLGASLGRPLVALYDDAVRSGLAAQILRVVEAGVNASVVASRALVGLHALPVEPLPPDELAVAVHDIAPVGPALYLELVERFGSDLAAMHRALRYWAAMDALRSTPHGLERSELLGAPTSPSTDGERAAALLALLGERVPEDVWVRACADAGLDLDALRDVASLTRHRDGWSVEPPEERDRLAQTAAPDLCAVAARALPQANLRQRVQAARLWVRAGERERGVESLWDAVNRDPLVRRTDHALVAFELLDDLLSAQDPRREWLWTRLSGQLCNVGRTEEAERLARRVLRQSDDPVNRFRCVHVLSSIHLLRGEAEQSLELLLAHALERSHPEYADWLTDVCVSLFHLGRFAEVEARCVGEDVPAGHCDMWRVRGESALYAGNIDLAEQCMERALDAPRFVDLGYALQLRAACRQMRGDLAGAEEGCLEAARASLGRVEWMQAMTNAALIAALRGRTDIARGRAFDLLPRLRRRDWRQNVAYVLAILWATTLDVHLAEEYGREARSLIDELRLPDGDLDALARQAMERAQAAGEGELVSRVSNWLRGRAESGGL